MKKKTRIIIISATSLVLTIGLVIAIPFTILGVKTANLKADYLYLKEDATCKEKVEITGLELVKQHVSCGYASIEMISTYYGNPVTEDDLDSRNGAISTASTDGFYKEINKSIPSKTFFKKTYLNNDQLLKEIHNSLKNNTALTTSFF